MERGVQGAMGLHASLSSSFSLHSLAEGSEAISEAEEFHEVSCQFHS